MVNALSYIGFRSPTAAGWPDFARSVLGSQVISNGVDDTVALRIDDHVERIYMRPAADDAIDFFGWNVDDAAAFDAQVQQIRNHGFDVEVDSSLAAKRHVAQLARFVGPFGHHHEITTGLATADTPFSPGRPMDGFVTGAGGLGHLVLLVPDLEKGLRFYTETLGFAISDRIDAHVSLTFLHCNERHHTIALVEVPDVVGMHHLMLEVQNLDDVGAALDAAVDAGCAIVSGIGKHPNDLMTSFYVQTPSAFEIEYGFGGRHIDDDWEIGHYTETSLWGHRPITSGPK